MDVKRQIEAGFLVKLFLMKIVINRQFISTTSKY